MLPSSKALRKTNNNKGKKKKSASCLELMNEKQIVKIEEGRGRASEKGDS